MRTKLEQLKQLEATYTEMQMLHESAAMPVAQPRPMMLAAAEDGARSQSSPSRVNEVVGGGGWSREPAEVAESVDDVDDESSVPPSPAPPPPRPRPPKNYRYVGLSLVPLLTSDSDLLGS